MIYVTGANGFLGSNFCKTYKGPLPITKVSYRDEPQDVFESHDVSCLIHFAWTSTTRNTYDDFERVIQNDVLNSKKIFDFYANKNPNGRIIFISTAGGLYVKHGRTVSETSDVNPQTLYGESKLQVENILKNVDCETVVFRVSNVWGGRDLPSTRINGLVDKLLSIVNTDQSINLYVDLDTRIDIIHVMDLVELINSCIERHVSHKHDMFVVGNQSLTIKQLLDIVSSRGYVNIKLSKSSDKGYLHVENSRCKKCFEWKPTRDLV